MMNDKQMPTNEEALFEQVEKDFTALMSEENLKLMDALINSSQYSYTVEPVRGTKEAEGKK